MKSTKIIYWVTTAIIFLWEGVMPAFTFNSEQAKQGISHLGYPEYFRLMLTAFKVIGGIILILPVFKGRIKEWAYAGYTFDFICAAVSYMAVDGFGFFAFFPFIFLAILMVSYVAYHKLNKYSATVIA
jgi:uncharacterized membrane protein YphA (DoxX/SURF4 family)